MIRHILFWNYTEKIKAERIHNMGQEAGLTSELVYANITSMMEDERRKQTEQKLIESGKAEFLKKGYAKANLRDLCKTAGVTT